jgi:hypothetical protein
MIKQRNSKWQRTKLTGIDGIAKQLEATALAPKDAACNWTRVQPDPHAQVTGICI